MDDHNTVKGGKGLHLAHLNVRSMMGGNKFDTLKHQVENSNIDIFTLSETWLSEPIPDNMIRLPSYNVSRWDRSWRDKENSKCPKKGGGLLCYVKKGHKFSDSKYAELNVSCKDLEMHWILLTLDNIRPIIVINIYRPPQGEFKKGCKLISRLKEPYTKIILNSILWVTLT